ncbi:MAG TPA: glycosyltransferase family 1 protein [Planctomycetes bacterium]|nr:glycosyltransferase family 1 protein [Planctomycetota bacterium]
MYKEQNKNSDESTNPRICIFSQRHLQRHVSRSAEYEFEDVVCEIDNVDLLVPQPHRLFVAGQKIANRLARHFFVSLANPCIQKLHLNKKYDLFLAVCQEPSDLLSLDAVREWRHNCKKSVCWLPEVWPGELHKFQGHLKVLSKFDHVVLNCNSSVTPVQDTVKSSCHYMPPGIDTIRFSPYPKPPLRSIDVYSMGRKSMVTHHALLKMAEERKIFYIYDTFENIKTLIPRDHRILVANIAKRSRYFVANAPKINRQSETHGQSGLSYRFLEGAASGTVMIGEPRENEEFARHLNWPDAVIHVPYDAENVAEILADLDSQPQRLAEIRKNNVVQTLLRHDYVYRWRDILDIVGLEPVPALHRREERLKELADMANKDQE